MRCNHCDNAPCTTICPTNALYRRSDGIVDFDNRRCIGCKACMQACPYDALYIDPNQNTAAKCNFCAHRVENSLEPACVIVCPTQAIITGDLDQPSSNIAQIVATKKVSVRKPQKGTQPKLYYVGIEGDLLEPSRLTRENTYVWAEQRDERAHSNGNGFGTLVDPAREVYDVAHPAPWGWKIGAYLWTKSIAAGVLIVSTVLMFGGHSAPFLFDVVAPAISLAALAATLFLLVVDLKRPDRFFYLLTKPNLNSWLVIGAYVLLAHGLLATAWLVIGSLSRSVPSVLLSFAGLSAIASAGYSAFLFAQAKGRDLWQSPLFLWHLILHALVAGCAVLVIAAIGFASAAGLLRPVAQLLVISLTIMLSMIVAELALPHISEDVRLATSALTKGRFSTRFWLLVITLGLLVPVALTVLVLASVLPVGALLLAALLALAGVWWFEDLWVKAGQCVPLS
jgi:formate-dependent nitrite reductase membrane component NrfD/ferredoxin